jgi:hypothetical protein
MQDMLLADIYQLKNPFDKPFTFRWNSKAYTVPASGRKLWPQPIAMHGANKIAEQLIRKNDGDMSVINKTLIAKYVAQVCTLFEATDQPNENALLDAKIAELNPEDGEIPMTPAEQEAARAEAQQKEEEENAFNQLNPEEAAEQDRLEALKQNNPTAYRAEILNQSTKKQLIELAEENEVEIDPKSNKETIIKALVEAGV